MKWRKFLPFIGLAIFVYILIRINIMSVLAEIEKVDLFYVLIAFVFVILIIFLQTFKWFMIARKQGIGIPYLEAVKIDLISNFYGFITPSKVGSVIRANYLKKYTKNIGKGVSNFIIDKVMDILSLFILAILMGFVFKDIFSINLLWYVIFLFVIFVFGAWLFYSKKRSRVLLRFVYRKIVPKKYKEKARLGFDSFYDNLPKKRFLMLVFFVNIITWVIIYFITYFVGLSLGIELNFIYYLAILPVATLIAQIPITINGLGTREAVMIALFGQFGIGAAKVFSMSIISLFLAGVVPAIITSFLIFKKEN